MIAMLTIFYLCPGSQDGCHSIIDAEFELDIHEVSNDAHQTFLEEHGWLLIGDMAYCPVCRYELHD